jgi:adenosylmethionine-8-amino-7-oxononanoate aminotransferase
LGQYDEFKTFFHGHTYTANPLACAVAVENLKMLKRDSVIRKSQASIRYLRQCLQPLRDLPNVGEVRQIGFMVGIELVQDKKTKKPFPSARKVGANVCRRARKHGLIIRPLGSVIILLPPFSFTKKDIKISCDVIERCIRSEIG